MNAVRGITDKCKAFGGIAPACCKLSLMHETRTRETNFSQPAFHFFLKRRGKGFFVDFISVGGRIDFSVQTMEERCFVIGKVASGPPGRKCSTATL